MNHDRTIGPLLANSTIYKFFWNKQSTSSIAGFLVFPILRFILLLIQITYITKPKIPGITCRSKASTQRWTTYDTLDTFPIQNNTNQLLFWVKCTNQSLFGWLLKWLLGTNKIERQANDSYDPISTATNMSILQSSLIPNITPVSPCLIGKASIQKKNFSWLVLEFHLWWSEQWLGGRIT